jgi:hypothetical protein
MKFLVVVKQKKNVDTFLDTIRALIARGHTVTLSVQERHDPKVEQLVAGLTPPAFSLKPGPAVRTDDWADTAPLLRSLSDCLHYQQPHLHGAQKLQARTIDKLREELRLQVDDRSAAGVLRQVPQQQIERLRAILDLAEQHLPTDPLYDSFLHRNGLTCCCCHRWCISGRRRLTWWRARSGWEFRSACCFSAGTT